MIKENINFKYDMTKKCVLMLISFSGETPAELHVDQASKAVSSSFFLNLSFFIIFNINKIM